MNAFRLARQAETFTPIPSTRTGIVSPWSTGDLTQVVWSDIFGVDQVPITRAEAMRLPAVARGRNLLCSTIAQLPLKAYRGADEVAAQPAWLYRTNGRTSPQHRMAWTVDDLIFTGWSLWAVERDTQGRILDGTRCSPERWRFEEGVVLLDDKPVTEESVILIPGLHEGVLAYGSVTVRAARLLEETWADRAANPIPATELHQNSDDELEPDEIQELLRSWVAARKLKGGAVAYTPNSIDVKTHGAAAEQLLVEGRNASAIDLARMLGIPAAMIDASNVNSTLTYETLQGRSLQFHDYSVSLYTTPISAALSMDDITPRGTRIGFDRSDATGPLPAPAGAPVAD